MGVIKKEGVSEREDGGAQKRTGRGRQGGGRVREKADPEGCREHRKCPRRSLGVSCEGGDARQGGEGEGRWRAASPFVYLFSQSGLAPPQLLGLVQMLNPAVVEGGCLCGVGSGGQQEAPRNMPPGLSWDSFPTPEREAPGKWTRRGVGDPSVPPGLEQAGWALVRAWTLGRRGLRLHLQ